MEGYQSEGGGWNWMRILGILVVAFLIVVMLVTFLAGGPGILLDKVLGRATPVAVVSEQPAVVATAPVPTTVRVVVQPTVTPVPERPTEVVVLTPKEKVVVVAPTKVVEPTKVPAEVPPTTAPPVEPMVELPKFTVGFDAFASYYNIILVKQLGLDKKYGFDLQMVTFCSTEQNCYTEDERSQKLGSGEWDVMLTTLDKLALNPNIGECIFTVDETDYADKVVVNPAVISTLNDLRGKRISYMEGSVGEFMVYYLLSLVQIQPNEVELLPAEDVVAAAELYVNGWVDAVSGWEPDVDAAVGAGGEVIISSHRLRVVIDVALASNQAVEQKAQLVQAFTDAWFEALKLQFEDPARAEQLVIAWGNNDWTWVAAEGDLQGWLETIAQSGLGPNQLAMSNISLLVERLAEAKRVWQWAGKVIPDMDYATRIEPAFVLSSAQNPALQASQAPINDTFLLTSRPNLPKLTEEELGGATTLAVLPLRKIEFEPDSTRLTEKATTNLKEQVLPVLVASTEVYLKVDGSSAWPGPAGRYTKEQIQDFAFQRALSVAQFLAGQGIDTDRLILGTVESRFPESTVEAELEQDRFVGFTLIVPPGR